MQISPNTHTPPKLAFGCQTSGSLLDAFYNTPSPTRHPSKLYSKTYQTRVSCKFQLTHTHHPNWRLGARPVAHFWMLSIIRLRQHVISPHDIVKPIRPECHANFT